MFRGKSKYFAAALLAGLLTSNDAATNLGTASGRLVGRILVEGKPVGNARACVHYSGCYHLPDKEKRPGFGGYRGGLKTSTWVSTNRHGIFHLELPIMPQYGENEERYAESLLILNVSAWVPGKGASHPFGVLIERNRDTRTSFRLLQTGEVSGLVFDERGAPRESVAVSLAAENTPCLAENPASWINDWSFGAMSDREGRFRFEGQVPGEYTLTAWSRNGLQVITAARPGEITVEAGKDSPVELLVIHDDTLFGRVLDPQDKPARDPNLRYSFQCCGDCEKPRSDGTFEVSLDDALVTRMPHSGPPRLANYVTLWVSNFNSDAAEVNHRENLAGGFSLDLSRPLPEHIDIQLQQTGTLVFDVREKPQGRPLKYIYWGFHRPGESRLPDSSQASRWERQLHLPCRTYSDDPVGGRHTIEGIPAGEYEIAITGGSRKAWATVSGNRLVVVEPGGTLRLDPVAFDAEPMLAGRVHNARVLGGSMRLDFASLANPSHKPIERSLYIHEDSTFSIPRPEAGRFRGIARVSCWNDGCTPETLLASVSDVFEFEAAPVDIWLHPAAQLRVSVVDAFGDRGTGWLVRIEPEDFSVPVAPFTTAVTMHGDIKSMPLPAGRYIVSVLEVGSSIPAITEVVALQASAGMQDFKITLPATSR